MQLEHVPRIEALKFCFADARASGGQFLNRSFSESQLNALSPATLAYLGDAVFELFVREQCLFPPQRLQDYHRHVVSQVKAETQATYARALIDHLTEPEMDIFRRGRNSAVGKPKRVSLTIYQYATGFEALIGYLYLTDVQRLKALLMLLPDFDL